MHLKTRNINTAFRELVKLLANRDANHAWSGACGHVPLSKKPSRNGNVLMIEEPVTVTYSHPRERVLFNTARDANPFFHLMESLWMLAGRNDVAPLSYYNSKIADFSDDGKTFNGAYGYRWRHVDGPLTVVDTGIGEFEETPDIDQLDLLVNHLKADPASRRAVLQMWNVEDDLLKIGGAKKDDPTGELEKKGWHNYKYVPGSKDVCCNLSVMFSLRERREVVDDFGEAETEVSYLDMTVTNRSNDLVWGMLGANYVHFSFLQEYMAARLGVEVGSYHHFTNNLHAYEWNWKPEEWLAEYNNRDMFSSPLLEYGKAELEGYSAPPLVSNPQTFEAELSAFVERHSKDAMAGEYKEPFLAKVAQPLLIAFHHYKRRNFKEALLCAEKIEAKDWQLAAINWLVRRALKAKEKS